MRLLYALSTAIALTATPTIASPFKAQNDVVVVPTEAGFLVTGDDGLGARGMWCAAADYAQKRLGARNGQRVYLAQARAGKQAVFTLDLAGLEPSSVFILATSVNRPGANLSLGHAIGFCADSKLLRNSLR